MRRLINDMIQLSEVNLNIFLNDNITDKGVSKGTQHCIICTKKFKFLPFQNIYGQFKYYVLCNKHDHDYEKCLSS